MRKKYKLGLKVVDGNLQLVPTGLLSQAGVEQLLGVSRAALTIFSTLTIDLRGVVVVNEAHLALLEKGLQELLTDKKLALKREYPELRWEVCPAAASPSVCCCEGKCQDCPHRTKSHGSNRRQELKKCGDHHG